MLWSSSSFIRVLLPGITNPFFGNRKETVFRRAGQSQMQYDTGGSMEIFDMTLPDRRMFSYFFTAMQGKEKKIDFDSFIKHDDVKILLEHGSISLNLIKKIWIAYIKKGNKLIEEDSYFALCDIIQSANKEESGYLEREYKYLCSKSTDNLFKIPDDTKEINKNIIKIKNQEEKVRKIIKKNDLAPIIDTEKRSQRIRTAKTFYGD